MGWQTGEITCTGAPSMDWLTLTYPKAGITHSERKLGSVFYPLRLPVIHRGAWTCGESRLLHGQRPQPSGHVQVGSPEAGLVQDPLERGHQVAGAVLQDARQAGQPDGRGGHLERDGAGRIVERRWRGDPWNWGNVGHANGIVRGGVGREWRGMPAAD